MRTTILAYVIAIVGVVMIVAGAWALFILDTATLPRIPLRYYAIAIGMYRAALACWALRRLCAYYSRFMARLRVFATTMK